MKFRVRDRIALAVYALFGLLGTLVFVGYAVYSSYVNVDMNIILTLLLAAVMLAMVVYSVFMLRFAFRNAGRDKNSVTVQNTEQGNGEVRVSVQALDSLVKQAIAGHSEGLADIKTSIINHEDSISVQIEMSLNGDVHIPNITMLLQSAIKGFIEEYSGIAVRDVSIMVKTIVPVMPQLAIAENSTQERVVLADEEHNEVAVQEEQAEADEVFAEEQNDGETPEQQAAEEEPFEQVFASEEENTQEDT